MINSLFSLKSIEDLAPIVLGVIQRALKRAADAHDKKKPLDIQQLYTGVTVRSLPSSLLAKAIILTVS